VSRIRSTILNHLKATELLLSIGISPNTACSTVDNTATNLGHETIHLASAFQLAGFTHIVANLWQSKDEACMQVAGDFYNALLNGETEEGDGGHERVSLALHGAVATLKEKMPEFPLVWAPFIHTGA
jgi:CHAT domain-containing protein